MQSIAEARAVNWYYAQNGQQAGPVPEAELESLAQRGVIMPSTLVWREGMAEWQPYSVTRQPALAATPAPAIAPPPVINQGQCVECQRYFAKDDLLRYENVLVCAMCKPAFFQKLREGVATGGGLWRSGKLLVMRKESVLPDRCVKCNKPTNGFRLKRNLTWHAPWLFVLIVAGVLIYLIVAMILSKKAGIQVGLCEDHRRIRRRDIIIAWALFFGAVGSFVLAGYLNPGYPYGLAGLALILVSLIYGTVRVPMVQPARIDDQFVWLKGVSREYVADLPEFTGRG